MSHPPFSLILQSSLPGSYFSSSNTYHLPQYGNVFTSSSPDIDITSFSFISESLYWPHAFCTSHMPLTYVIFFSYILYLSFHHFPHFLAVSLKGLRSYLLFFGSPSRVSLQNIVPLSSLFFHLLQLFPPSFKGFFVGLLSLIVYCSLVHLFACPCLTRFLSLILFLPPSPLFLSPSLASGRLRGFTLLLFQHNGRSTGPELLRM